MQPIEFDLLLTGHNDKQLEASPDKLSEHYKSAIKKSIRNSRTIGELGPDVLVEGTLFDLK